MSLFNGNRLHVASAESLVRLQAQIHRQVSTAGYPAERLTGYLLDRANLEAAWERMRTRGGACTPGPDGLAANDIQRRLAAWLDQLAAELRGNSYAPTPPRLGRCSQNVAFGRNTAAGHPDHSRPGGSLGAQTDSRTSLGAVLRSNKLRLSSRAVRAGRIDSGIPVAGWARRFLAFPLGNAPSTSPIASTPSTTPYSLPRWATTSRTVRSEGSCGKSSRWAATRIRLVLLETPLRHRPGERSVAAVVQSLPAQA